MLGRNDDCPCRILTYGKGTTVKVWLKKGVAHRVNAPYLTCERMIDGKLVPQYELWKQNGDWHRTDGRPAVRFNTSYTYYEYGRLHRVSGPANEDFYESSWGDRYYIRRKSLTKQSFSRIRRIYTKCLHNLQRKRRHHILLRLIQHSDILKDLCTIIASYC
jgi:hypothetical protein